MTVKELKDILHKLNDTFEIAICSGYLDLDNTYKLTDILEIKDVKTDTSTAIFIID